MDDKLYYVESPTGQVLGPMNMMQILEGIAAGKILETARICEVGKQEWIALGDVAYARENETPMSVPAADPADAISRTTPPPMEEEEPATPAPIASAPEPTYEPPTPAPVEPAAAIPPTPVESPIAAAPEETPPVNPDMIPMGDPAGDFEAFQQPPPVHSEPVGADPLATASAPIAPEDLPLSARPFDPSELPESARPFDPSEEAPDGASDFALQMPTDEGEDHVDDETDDAKPRRKGWVIPLAVAVALPVIGGIYYMAGGKIPYLSIDPGREMSTQVEDPTPTPPTGDLPPLEAAWKLLAEGEARAAMRGFRQVLLENPDDAEAHHGLGRSASAAGDQELAINHLEKALGFDPENKICTFDLAHAHLMAGDPATAETVARAGLEKFGNAPQGHLIIGKALTAQGDHDGAVQTLTKYIDVNAKDQAARLPLAQALAATGRTEPAIEEIGLYLQAYPDDEDAQYSRLEWMISVGKTSEASSIYAGLAQKNPKSAFYQYLAGLAHPDSEEGVAFLRRAVDLNPNDGDAYSKLGEYLLKLGRKGEAATAFDRAFLIRPANAEERALFARVRQAPRLPEATRQDTVTPAAGQAVSLADHISRIQKALKNEDFTQARTVLRTGQLDLQGSSEAMASLELWEGIIDLESGDFDAAISRFESLDPQASFGDAGYGTGAAVNWTARAHFSKGDARSAVAILDQVKLDDVNEYATARLWEGMALSSLGMEDLATRTWSRVSSDVGDSATRQGRAAVKSAEFMLGSISEKEYRTAVSSVPGFENDMHLFLAYGALRRENPELARAHFMKTLQASEGQEFPYHLADVEITGNGLVR